VRFGEGGDCWVTRSAVVLAGGLSSRFGEDKGLLRLAGKPLVRHVLDGLKNVVDERMVVVSSQTQTACYRDAVGSDVNVAVDELHEHSPLVGAMTGFKVASGEHCLLLPCDTPFVSVEVVVLLFDLCLNKAAVIPRWPNCYLEPLHAVYYREMALDAAEKALGEGKLNMQSMIEKLRGVRYVSTLVLQQLDPELRTFFNVNTPLDLKKAEAILKRSR
jgi:molybdopterin-guanine dinucleotide biosynthesis protein A